MSSTGELFGGREICMWLLLLKDSIDLPVLFPALHLCLQPAVCLSHPISSLGGYDPLSGPP